MKRLLSLGDITGGSSNVAIDDDDDGSFTQVRRHRDKKPKKTEATQKQPDTSVSSQRKPTAPVRQSVTNYVLYRENIDCVCVTESWLTDDITDGLLDHRSMFTIIKHNRSHSKGGGVCVLIK